MATACSQCKIKIVYTSYQYDKCAGRGFTDKTLCCHCAFQKMMDKERKLANNPQRERPSDTGRAWHFLSVNGCMQCNFRAKVDEPNFFLMKWDRHLKQKVEDLQDEIKEHEKRIDFLLKEIARRDEELKRLREEHKKCVEEREEIAQGWEDDLAQKQDEIEKLEIELENLREEHNRHEKDRSMKEKQLKILETEHNETIAKLKESNDKLNDKILDFVGQVEEKDRQIKGIEQELNDVKANLNVERVKIATQELKHQQEMVEKENTINNLRLENETLKVFEANYKGNVDALKEENAELQTKVRSLERSNTDLQARIQSLGEEKNRIEATHEVFKKALEAKDVQLRAKETRIQKLKVESTIESTDLSELRNSIENMLNHLTAAVFEKGAADDDTALQKIHDKMNDLRDTGLTPLSSAIQNLIQANSHEAKTVFKTVVMLVTDYSLILEGIQRVYDETNNIDEFKKEIEPIEKNDIPSLKARIQENINRIVEKINRDRGLESSS